ncbi:MAG: hypothetical protein LBM75_00085 [Myxococcales bacterium]|jgi:hypothetical protein|nr:hypothetical protein [Myxococcales bacterium]
MNAPISERIRNRNQTPIVLTAVLTMALAACAPAKKKEATPTLGHRLSEAPARQLRATSDGKHLVFLTDVKKPTLPDVPEDLMVGQLATVPSEGGALRVLGQGVTTLDGAFHLSPDGRWVAFLEGFVIGRHVGVLSLAALGRTEKPRQLAEDVSFYRFSKDAKWLGFVASEAFHLHDLTSGKDLLVEEGVATFEFSPAGNAVLFRKPLSAGGQLRLAAIGGDTTPRVSTVAERVGDYGFSPDGKFFALTSRAGGTGAPYQVFVGESGTSKPRSIGEKAGAFIFSPDSKRLAFIANQTPGMPYGDLFVMSLPDETSARIGTSVADFRFAPTSDALALRENQLNERGQAWQEFKVVRVPAGEVRLHQKSLPKSFINFLFSDDGRALAFIKHEKADLDLWRLDMASGSDAPPERVAPWTFEYRFRAAAPGARADLWYRGTCIREGRQCDLFVDEPIAAPTAAIESADAGPGPDAGNAAETPLPAPAHLKVASALSAFEFSPSGNRLFLDLPRFDTTTSFDLAWQAPMPGAVTAPIDRHVLKHSLRALDPDGKRVAYIVTERRREGVYVAELP